MTVSFPRHYKKGILAFTQTFFLSERILDINPLLVELGSLEITHPEKTNLDKVKVGIEQVVPVPTKTLHILLVKILPLRIVPWRFFFHEPFLGQVPTQRLSGTPFVRAL